MKKHLDIIYNQCFLDFYIWYKTGYYMPFDARDNSLNEFGKNFNGLTLSTEDVLKARDILMKLK